MLVYLSACVRWLRLQNTATKTLGIAHNQGSVAPQFLYIAAVSKIYKNESV